jgi:hypothetical protein
MLQPTLRRMRKGVPASRPLLELKVSSSPFLTCWRLVVDSMPVWRRVAMADATQFQQEHPSLHRIFGRGRHRNQQRR